MFGNYIDKETKKAWVNSRIGTIETLEL